MPFDYGDNLLNTGLYEFPTFFSGNTGDLTTTATGSGVHLFKDVRIQLDVLDRDENSYNDEGSFLSSPFTSKLQIDIIDVPEDDEISGEDIKTGYLFDYKNPFFTFNEQENIDVFGDYAKHFGIRTKLIAQDGLESESEFYFYGNIPVISGVAVKDGTGTTFHTGSSSDKSGVNSTGQTGQVSLTMTFDNNMSYVKMKELDVFITTGSGFDIEEVDATLFPSYTRPINQLGIQTFPIDETKFDTNSGDYYFHLVPYSEIGSGVAWTVGPNRIIKQPINRSPFATTDESVLVYGEQTAAGDKTFVGERTVMGGSGHDIVASTTGNFIGGGRSNSITGVTPAFNFLGGGSGNSLITSDYSSLVGGLENSITGGDFNFIGGGSGIDLKDSNYSIIVGGVNNITSGSNDCFIGGGEGNSVKNVSNSSIGGGVGNKITGEGHFSFIGGGNSNSIDVVGSAIVGGTANKITSGQGLDGYSFIGGGEENLIYSQFGTILGGESNIVSGNFSTIAAGQSNQIYGEDSFVAGGISSITSGDRNIGLGTSVKIPASDDGAMVLADGQSRDHFSSGEHTAVLDFASGVYIESQSGLYVNGSPVLTSETDDQTLDEVLAQGNTSSSNISVGAITGTYLDITNDVFVAGDVEASEFIGDLQGAVSFRAKAGEALSAGEVVYISGINGNTTVVAKADADDPNKMPAFGVSKQTVNANANVLVANFGSVTNLDTSSYSEGDELFISDVAGQLTGVAPTGEASALQKMAKVTRSHASSGSITVMGAGRSNAVPNLNEGRLFVGNSSNKAIADGTIHVDIANSKVGIGTTSPDYKLDIGGDTGSTSNTIRMVQAANGTAIRIGAGGGANDVTLLRVDGSFDPDNRGESDSSYYGFSMKYFGSGSGNGNRFGFLADNQNASTQVEAISILQDGKVGIGTTSPSEKLEVAGNIAATGNIAVSGNLRTNTVSTRDKLRLWGTSPDYTIGMESAVTFAGLNDYAMTFQFSNTSARGFWWGDTAHSKAQGAMALTTDGLLTVASKIKVGFGESDTTTPSTYDIQTNDSVRVGGDLSIADNVGIGTTSPASQLEVYSNTSSIIAESRITNTGTAGYGGQSNLWLKSTATGNTLLAFGPSTSGDTAANATGGISYGAAAATLNIKTNSSTRMTINSSGDVGIGTTSPIAKLDIRTPQTTAAFTNPALKLLPSSTTNDTGLTSISFSTTTVTTAYGFSVNAWRRSGNDTFTIKSHYNSATGVDRLVIQNNGNVGIGTTSPSQKLDVYGTAVISGNVGIGTTSPSEKLEVAGTIKSRDVKLDSGYHLMRSNHHSGHLEGGYNNVGNSADKSSPIYTIGSSYNPTDAALSNMYGIGYTNAPSASFISFTGASGWGQYVASAGVARVWLDGGNGVISSIGEHYVGSSRVFHDTYHPNADTLTTARTINGVSFNGSANITVADSTKLPLAGGTLTGGLNVSSGNVGIGTTSPSAKLEVNGHFAATTKSFIIDDPKKGGKLQYGVVESNEHGVYVRGTSDTTEITLPDEWEWLVDADSVTVQLTSVGKIQQLFVIEQNNKKITIGGLATGGRYNYNVYGTRKDVDPLELHIK